jgi:hypothetical protein
VVPDASEDSLERLLEPSVLRRTWEEADTLYSPDPLYRLFPDLPPFRPERARTAALILGVFALVNLSLFRFAAGRGPGIVTALGVGVAAAAGVVLIVAVPPLPEVETTTLTVLYGERRITLTRFTARDPGVAESGWDGPPIVLGAHAEPVVHQVEGGTFLMRLSLRRGETRIAVAESFGTPPAPGEVDAILGRPGVAFADGRFLPAGEFLDQAARRGWPERRTLALRRLFRLVDRPASPVGIRFREGRDETIEVLPLGQ